MYPKVPLRGQKLECRALRHYPPGILAPSANPRFIATNLRDAPEFFYDELHGQRSSHSGTVAEDRGPPSFAIPGGVGNAGGQRI